MVALNDKEKIFVKEYIICKGSAYQAALKAGYKKSTAKYAYEWLLETLKNSTTKRHLPYKPYLKQALDDELEKLHNEKTADEKEVVEYLTSVMRGESVSEVVVTEFVGEGCSMAKRVEKAPDEKEKLKAAELLGKTYGIFTDKAQVDLALPIFEGESSLED